MKKLYFLAAFLIQGCEYSIPEAAMVQAMNTCQNRGGVDTMKLHVSRYVQCRDKSLFHIDSR